MANARREADNDPLKEQLGDVAKLKGRMIEDLGRHKSTKLTRDERIIYKALKFPFFDDLEEISGSYEIKEFK